jgi:hypothetical protein
MIIISGMRTLCRQGLNLEPRYSPAEFRHSLVNDDVLGFSRGNSEKCRDHLWSGNEG